MRIAPLAALGLGLAAALAACETVHRGSVTFPSEPNVWIRYTDEGFWGDTIATFHNGLNRDVCVRARDSRVGGYLIPANSTIRRPGTLLAWTDVMVIYDPAQFNGCRRVQPG